jgi:hypothetical protein
MSPLPTSSIAPHLRALGDEAAIVTAAERILACGLWGVIEVCVDVPGQAWEPRLVVCRREAWAVAKAVAAWTRSAPDRDVRLSGCRRSDLHVQADAPTHLCHLAARAPSGG